MALHLSRKSNRKETAMVDVHGRQLAGERIRRIALHEYQQSCCTYDYHSGRLDTGEASIGATSNRKPTCVLSGVHTYIRQDFASWHTPPKKLAYHLELVNHRSLRRHGPNQGGGGKNDGA